MPQHPTRKTYTPEQRERALALAIEEGTSAAARELGIPKTTISNWRNRPRTKAQPVSKPRRPTSQRRYTPSQKAEILEFVGTHSVTEAIAKFGVSKFSIYAWKKAVARAARGEGDSPTSGPDPADVEAQRDKEILDEWRRHPGLGSDLEGDAGAEDHCRAPRPR